MKQKINKSKANTHFGQSLTVKSPVPIQRLLFYEIPCSNSHFLETIVPSLKASLSLTLKHFTPLAGNLIHPLIGLSKPVFQYKSGDSVSLIIAEANEAPDFHYITGNQPRDADYFYGFVSELPTEKIELDSKIILLLALQVTLFPDAEQLKGSDGFLIAAELIGELISKKVNNKDEILKDAENWLPLFGGLVKKQISDVVGSPKFDLYDTDYGWDNPKKFESVSIDGDGSMSFSKSREFEGGLEIGLSLRKSEMDAFAPIFNTAKQYLEVAN